MKRFLVVTILTLLCQPLFAAKVKVLLGVDVLEKNRFDVLQGKRIGLITNHTGQNSLGKSTVDVLFEAEGVTLVAIFGPEHGLRGKEAHGKKINDGLDAKTRLPVYSLYGKTKRPTDDMLKGLDALVFDIQDIGTRFYTYTTTLAYALEEAAKRNIEFIVLDRPNPITGAIVEGEPLDPAINHFTAYLRVPTRHGMTVGEIAKWHNRTAGLNAKLTVVKMEGWTRNLWLDETTLKFKPTSPNMRTLTAATLYPGIGCFEATNVAVGRGTKTPFEIFGAPWMDGEAVVEKLNFYMPFGFDFKAVKFTPKDDLYKGQVCGGVKVMVSDRTEARPLELFMQTAQILKEMYPDQFVLRWEEVARVTGSNQFKSMMDRGFSAEAMLHIFRQSAKDFADTAKPDLLYP